MLNPEEHSIPDAQIPIQTARHQPLIGGCCNVYEVMHCAGFTFAKAIGIVRIDPTSAAQRIEEVTWQGSLCTGSAVVEVKYLLVELVGCGPRTEDRVDVCHRCVLEWLAGQNDSIPCRH